MTRYLTLAALLGLTFCFLTPTTAFAQDAEAELATKLEATDFTDPDAVFELAQWAMACKTSHKVRTEGRKFMQEVLSIDEDHERAREVLGYKKLGDKWLTEKDYKKERQKIQKVEMKEKGYVPFKGGWIKAAQKRDWNNRWEKDDDDVWISFEEVQAKKGLSLYQGAWLRLGEAERKRMEHHRKMTGSDILVAGTPHFLLHMGIKAEEVQRYTEKVEEVFNWYVKSFDVPQPAEGSLWGASQVHIWHFETEQEFQDWITTYSEDYQFDDDDKKQFRERPGGYLIPHKRLICVVRKRAEEIENPMIHHIGSMLLYWHLQGRATSWMSEAVGHLVDHTMSTEEYGYTNCSTNSRYAGGGGIAQKEFNTKDGKPRMRSILKAGDE
ncbi:MAG: hypothetical protein KDB18_12760, partial [Salinibacterium sp.]|nr:hypothetical protein [Salinibacterium sp.]